MTRILTFVAGLAVVIVSGVVYGAWTQRWQESARPRKRRLPICRICPKKWALGRPSPPSLNRMLSTLPAPRVGGSAASLTNAPGRACLQSCCAARRPAQRPSAGNLLCLRRLRFGRGSRSHTIHADSATRRRLNFGPGYSRNPRRAVNGCASSGPGTTAKLGAARDDPRWTFAHLPALFKLYVIRETTGRPRSARRRSLRRLPAPRVAGDVAHVVRAVNPMLQLSGEPPSVCRPVRRPRRSESRRSSLMRNPMSSAVAHQPSSVLVPPFSPPASAAPRNALGFVLFLLVNAALFLRPAEIVPDVLDGTSTSS